MDPQTDLPDLVEDLEVNIDELTETLSPLLSTPLSTTATSLPLLDKAKLYVLAAYAVESLLFSTLQASGVDAKSHAVFTELARLRTYFAKIKDVEERLPGGPWENRARVDKEAAARFIKHGLSGNDRYDKERAERMAREKARALEKAKTVNKKFDDEEGDEVQDATPRKRGAEDDDEDEAETTPAAKKLRSGKGRSKKDVESTPDTDAPTPARSTRSATALQDGAAASPVPATKTKTKTKGKGKGKGKAK